jgi:hypothetical protein
MFYLMLLCAYVGARLSPDVVSVTPMLVISVVTIC